MLGWMAPVIRGRRRPILSTMKRTYISVVTSLTCSKRQRSLHARTQRHWGQDAYNTVYSCGKKALRGA